MMVTNTYIEKCATDITRQLMERKHIFKICFKNVKIDASWINHEQIMWTLLFHDPYANDSAYKI